jgi:hypothetical protein
MVPAAPEGVHLLFERLLSRGAAALSHQELDEVSRQLREQGHDQLARALTQARANESQYIALLDALAETRRRLVDQMAVLRLEQGQRGTKRDMQLLALNALVGAEEATEPPQGHLLHQIDSLPTYAARELIEGCSDGATLWCLVLSGRIAEQRAAVRRLGQLMASGSLVDSDGLDGRALSGKLTALREPRIAFDVDNALAEMPGSSGRAARQRRTRAERLLTRVVAEARRYWAGESEHDPLTRLSREEALRLGVWLRHGDDELAAHVAEYLRNLLRRCRVARLADAVGIFIPSGDERLVPTLCRLLADAPQNARIAAARAMARLADPRVHRALVKAYRHAEDVLERTVLGGALGQQGDRRALSFLMQGITQNEPELWEETLRSLGSIGAGEAAAKLVPLLDSERPALARAAAQALIRCGGPEELGRLRDMAQHHPQYSAVLAQAAEGLGLRLRLLRRVPEDHEALSPATTVAWQEPALPTTQHKLEPSTRDRVYAFFLFVTGLFWGLLSQRLRAIEAFAQSARLAPRMASPHLQQALLHASRQRDDLAIDSFRRALRANLVGVLRRPLWVRRLLLVYLRRADNLVAQRRKRAALTLLDEVAGLDLRQGDLDLRLALARRRDRLLVDRARQSLAQGRSE